MSAIAYEEETGMFGSSLCDHQSPRSFTHLNDHEALGQIRTLPLTKFWHAPASLRPLAGATHHSLDS